MTDQVRNSPACSEPPSRPILCVTGCGFFGNARTDNMCSVCHKKANSTKNSTATTSTTSTTTTNTNNATQSSNNSTNQPTSSPSTSPHLTISTPNTIPSMNLPLNSQTLTPITPIQRAPAPSPFSMSLADPIPDSLSVPFFEPFTEPPSIASIASPTSTITLSNFENNTNTNNEAQVEKINPPTSTLKIEAPIATVAIPPPEKLAAPAPSKPLKNRCKICARKVGLAYFNCKCDEDAMFCSSHRYPHAHACTHSHRTDQQEKLAKANPIVKNDQFERL